MTTLISASRLKVLALSTAIAVYGTVSSAELLKLQPNSANTKIESVPLAASATTDKGAKLSFVGAGLRAKKVVFVNVKVYVAQLFAADAAKLKKSDAEILGSLDSAAPVALQMNFLREVEASKVQSSFKEALEANKVDMNKPEIKKFLDAVQTGGKAKEGKTLTLLAVKNPDATETVTYEDANGKATAVSGAAGFTRDVLSIWLGKPSDDGVARLKSDLLK
jgi:hypothetical protein